MKFHYGIHTKPRELWDQVTTEHPHVVAADTETISLSDRTVLGVGVAVSTTDAFYLTADDPEYYKLIQILSNPAIPKVYHNANFDLRVMRSEGVDSSNVHDTAIAARLKGISGVLEEASFYTRTEVESAKSFMTRRGITHMDQADPADIARKCCVDANATLKLYHYLDDVIQSDYYKVEQQMFHILEQISQRGIKIDAQRNEELDTYYTREVSFYRTLCDNLGFNPASFFEVGYILSERGAFLPMGRGGRYLSTDEKTLNKVTAPDAVPVAQLVLLFRRDSRSLSTYVKPFEGQERGYTNLHMDAVTGRINGTNAGKHEPDRNLLNITKRSDRHMPDHLRLRSQFIPDADELTMADDSQVEMRILAYLSQDPRMLAVFADPNGDIHLDTEQEVWGTSGIYRLDAKVFNYAMLYGGDAATVAENIGTPDVARIQYLMQVWSETYPVAWAWRLEQIRLGTEVGYVETLYGRRMEIPIDQGEKHAANCSINYPIQGTAADIFKRSLIECQDLPILLPVHDERVMNGRVVMPSGIEDISPIHVPVEMKYAERWG